MKHAKAKSDAAALLGRLGGSVTSKRKAAAARANGKKGGRPKKDPLRAALEAQADLEISGWPKGKPRKAKKGKR